MIPCENDDPAIPGYTAITIDYVRCNTVQEIKQANARSRREIVSVSRYSVTATHLHTSILLSMMDRYRKTYQDKYSTNIRSGMIAKYTCALHATIVGSNWVTRQCESNGSRHTNQRWIKYAKLNDKSQTRYAKPVNLLLGTLMQGRTLEKRGVNSMHKIFFQCSRLIASYETCVSYNYIVISDRSIVLDAL